MLDFYGVLDDFILQDLFEDEEEDDDYDLDADIFLHEMETNETSGDTSSG